MFIPTWYFVLSLMAVARQGFLFLMSLFSGNHALANDEVNLAARDESVAAQLSKDFAADIAASREITFADWKRRPLPERLHEAIGWALQRQQ